MSSAWNFDVKQVQILNFSQESGENGVEVDSDKSFFSKRGVFSVEEELVELAAGLFVDSGFPALDLLLVVLHDVFAQ